MTLDEMPQVAAKVLLTHSKSPSAWFGSEYNMNLYRGCVHGCLYCDSRSDCYRVEQFDSVAVKTNAIALLRDNLSHKVKTGLVATGAMSDPYNPYEKELLLTRHALELLSAYGFGAALATKSDWVVRDTDVLMEIAENSPVIAKMTITTLDETLAEKLEPRAPAPSRRLEAVRTLSKAGVFTGVLLMPVLPFITDDPQAIAELVYAVADAGARFIYAGFGVTMRQGQREHFLHGLDAAFPGEKYRQKYLQKYGMRYHCASPRAKSCYESFAAACQKTGLLHEMRDIIAASRQKYRREQLSFF